MGIYCFERVVLAELSRACKLIEIVTYFAKKNSKKLLSMQYQSMQCEKILHSFIQCKYMYMGTISKYIIIENISHVYFF